MLAKLWVYRTTPVLPEITRGNVGACDRLWNAGVREEVCTVDGSPTLIGVTVNTNRRMYIFELTRGSTYCRAARFVATNKGVVFDQNLPPGPGGLQDRRQSGDHGAAFL